MVDELSGETLLPKEQLEKLYLEVQNDPSLSAIAEWTLINTDKKYNREVFINNAKSREKLECLERELAELKETLVAGF